MVLAATLAALYLIGMAAAFGGTLGVALVTAPALFKKLDSRVAGDAFGLVLRRFDKLGFVLSLVATLASGIGLVVFGISARGALCTATAVTVLACFWTSRNVLLPAIEPISPPREPGAEDPRSDEERAAFDALHKRHVQVYSLILFASLAGLVLFALAG